MAPGRYGASHSSTVSIRCPVDQSGHGAPSDRCRNATRSRNDVAASDHRSTPSCVARTACHQRCGRLVARLGATDTLAELDRSQPALHRLHEVVAFGVPVERSAFDDLAAELGDDVVGVDHGGEPDPGSLAVAVEVGSDDEQLIGERVVVGKPGARSRSELELAGPSPGGQPIGISEQEHDARSVGIDVVEIEGDARSSRQVGGPITQAMDRAPIGRVMAAATGEGTDA